MYIRLRWEDARLISQALTYDTRGMAKTLKQQATEQLISQLANEGDRILRQCVEQRDYIHRTYNLYDSYGYGVYVKGRLMRRGFLQRSPQASDPREWYGENVRGREEILEFLTSGYKPSQNIELVIAAAMPYASVLESGKGLRHKYKVISMSYDMLRDIAQKYNGTVKTITGNG